MRKILSVWGMILLMLVLIAGTVAAQSGVDPTVTPTAVPTSQPAGSTNYTHPIVQVLSAYFGRMTRPMLPTPTLVPTQTPTVDPSATPTEVTSETPTATPTAAPVMGPEEFAEQIAMYHDEGIGFGVLVKLYAMAEDSAKACADQQAIDPNQPTCEAVTVEQLVSEFQSGIGMGQLFKEYGKPALLGVGHVRKSLQNQPEEPQSTPVPTAIATPAPTMGSTDLQTQGLDSNNGNGNGNNPAKGKSNKPHGPKK
jgi:hypothetical protein